MPKLNPPAPGLRALSTRLRNRSNDIARVDLVVPAGAEIDTDDPNVVAQLLANSAFVQEERARQDAKAEPTVVEEAGGGSARRSSGRRS